MSKVEQLLAKVDLARTIETGATHARVQVLRAVPQLIALWSACEAERDAVCETESLTTDDYTQLSDGECAGDTHDDTCPVAIARAAITAVLERGLP